MGSMTSLKTIKVLRALFALYGIWTAVLCFFASKTSNPNHGGVQ